MKKLTLLDIVSVTAEVISSEMQSDMSKYLMDTTEVVHRQITEGSVTIESEYDEAYSSPYVVTLALKKAEAQEMDGIFSTALAITASVLSVKS